MITLDVNNASRYDDAVIRSFRDRDTEDVFVRLPARRLPSDILRAARRKPLILDAAESLADLRVPPGNRLERLSGERAGQYSIRINIRWRICFSWREGDAYDVEIVDYH
jgi:proteic killer suppression protein